MTHQPEFRVLCNQLSTTPVANLPKLIPNLLRNVLRCNDVISNGASQPDASGTSVLIHKLKTQLTSLLTGKQHEGRFVAIILIKAIVDVGGWEVLNSSGSWVRGLVAIIGKSDPHVTKELCIITLTKLYILIHRYQELVREISTPTLPTYVTSCINLLSSRSSSKAHGVSHTLLEAVFGSFTLLVRQHTSIFRPFSSQIRLLIGRFISPSISEDSFIPSSLKQSARRLLVSLHESAPKNTCGEEWSKAIRDLVRNVHLISDQIFRSLVEDWESTAGHVCEPVDLSKEIHGVDTTGYLSPWTGIDAGIDRLIAILEILVVYFQEETSGPVTVSIGVIRDLITRLLSITIPTLNEPLNRRISMHWNSSVGRDEQDYLSCQVPYIYIATLKLNLAIVDRIQDSFMSLSSECFDQIAWVFPKARNNPEFRLVTYKLMARVLPIAGKGLRKDQTKNFLPIIKSCCQELFNEETSKASQERDDQERKHKSSIIHGLNIKSLTGPLTDVPNPSKVGAQDIVNSASHLLPYFLSHIPQHYLSIFTRSMIERTAILSKNKEAMLASVLNPFTGKCNKEITSILPHLTREFSSDDVVEILLRPRMPQISIPSIKLHQSKSKDYDSDEDEMDYQHEISGSPQILPSANISVISQPSFLELNTKPLDHTSNMLDSETQINESKFRIIDESNQPTSFTADMTISNPLETEPYIPTHLNTDVVEMSLDKIDDDDDDDDNESVHLTMQLDTDIETSEDEAGKS